MDILPKSYLATKKKKQGFTFPSIRMQQVQLKRKTKYISTKNNISEKTHWVVINIFTY